MLTDAETGSFPDTVNECTFYRWNCAIRGGCTPDSRWSIEPLYRAIVSLALVDGLVDLSDENAYPVEVPGLMDYGQWAREELLGNALIEDEESATDNPVDIYRSLMGLNVLTDEDGQRWKEVFNIKPRQGVAEFSIDVQDTAEGMPYSDVTIPVTVQNAGDFADEFEVFARDLPESENPEETWTVDTQRVWISSEGEETVDLVVHIPHDEIGIERTIKVGAMPINRDHQAKVEPVTISVESFLVCGGGAAAQAKHIDHLVRKKGTSIFAMEEDGSNTQCISDGAGYHSFIPSPVGYRSPSINFYAWVQWYSGRYEVIDVVSPGLDYHKPRNANKPGREFVLPLSSLIACDSATEITGVYTPQDIKNMGEGIWNQSFDLSGDEYDFEDVTYFAGKETDLGMFYIHGEWSRVDDWKVKVKFGKAEYQDDCSYENVQWQGDDDISPLLPWEQDKGYIDPHKVCIKFNVDIPPDAHHGFYFTSLTRLKWKQGENTPTPLNESPRLMLGIYVYYDNAILTTNTIYNNIGTYIDDFAKTRNAIVRKIPTFRESFNKCSKDQLEKQLDGTYNRACIQSYLSDKAEYAEETVLPKINTIRTELDGVVSDYEDSLGNARYYFTIIGNDDDIPYRRVKDPVCTVDSNDDVCESKKTTYSEILDIERNYRNDGSEMIPSDSAYFLEHPIISKMEMKWVLGRIPRIRDDYTFLKNYLEWAIKPQKVTDKSAEVIGRMDNDIRMDQFANMLESKGFGTFDFGKSQWAHTDDPPHNKDCTTSACVYRSHNEDSTNGGDEEIAYMGASDLVIVVNPGTLFDDYFSTWNIAFDYDNPVETSPRTLEGGVLSFLPSSCDANTPAFFHPTTIVDTSDSIAKPIPFNYFKSINSACNNGDIQAVSSNLATSYLGWPDSGVHTGAGVVISPTADITFERPGDTSAKRNEGWLYQYYFIDSVQCDLDVGETFLRSLVKYRNNFNNRISENDPGRYEDYKEHVEKLILAMSLLGDPKLPICESMHKLDVTTTAEVTINNQDYTYSGKAYKAETCRVSSGGVQNCDRPTVNIEIRFPVPINGLDCRNYLELTITRADGVIHEIGSNRRTRITTEGSDTCKYYLRIDGETIKGDIITGTYHIIAEYNEYAGTGFFSIIGGRMMEFPDWGLPVTNKYGTTPIEKIKHLKTMGFNGITLLITLDKHLHPDHPDDISKVLKKLNAYIHDNNMFVYVGFSEMGSFMTLLDSNVRLMKNLKYIIDFNNQVERPEERIDGIMLDIEPGQDYGPFENEKSEVAVFQSRLFSLIKTVSHNELMPFGNHVMRIHVGPSPPTPQTGPSTDPPYYTVIDSIGSGTDYSEFSKRMDIISPMTYVPSQYYNDWRVSYHYTQAQAHYSLEQARDGNDVRALTYPTLRASDTMLIDYNCNLIDMFKVNDACDAYNDGLDQIFIDTEYFSSINVLRDSGKFLYDSGPYKNTPQGYYTPNGQVWYQFQSFVDVGHIGPVINTDPAEYKEIKAGQCLVWAVVPRCGADAAMDAFSSRFAIEPGYAGEMIWQYPGYYLPVNEEAVACP